MIIYDIRPPQKRRTTNVPNLKKGNKTIAIPKTNRNMQKIFAVIFIFLLAIPFGIWQVKKAIADNTTLYVNTASTAGGTCLTNATTGDDRACASLFEAESKLPADITEAGGADAGIWTIIAEGETADTTAVTFSGTITDATHYINVTTDSGATNGRHNGTYQITKYRLADATVTIQNNYIKLDGIQFVKTVNANSNIIIINANGAGVTISNSIIKSLGGTTNVENGIYVSIASANVNIFNTLIYGISTGANSGNNGILIGNATAVNIYSSTIVGGYRAINRSAGTVTCKNCYAGGSASNAYYGTITQLTSASSDTTADGTDLDNIAINTINFTNVTAGSEDFHLPFGSALIGVGTDGPDADPLDFTTDIDGQTRTSVWDIGADEYVVAPDDQLPVVTEFTIPATSTSRMISISAFTATDNMGVTGYKITESATAPGAGDAGWTGSAPATYTITGSGTSHTLYGWAKDAAGNVSLGVSDSITINPTAATCAISDIQSELDLAVAGDTLNIPAGNCTWASTLTINKSISLIGAGKNSTIINHDGGANTKLINVSLASDVPLRISGIGFVFPTNDGGHYMTAIYVSGTGLTQIRIDNNGFTKGQGTLWINGQVYGVADHNTFTNVNVNYFTGLGDTEWNRATIQAGTANAFFLEDNSIIYNNDSEETSADAVVYIQEGASVVVRYNTFDASALTTSVSGLTILNNHANQGYYPNGTVKRGSPVFEAYNNTITDYGGSSYGNMFGVRGGSVLIHDNTITKTVTANNIFGKLDEEECWQTLMFSPLRTEWPAQDQIHNSFFWNNTWNGSTASPTLQSQACVGTFVQQDRDYFLHAPQSSGGYEYFTGSRKGGSQTAPTEADTGSMAFSSSGANAYYPYTPYTYPHPLTGVIDSTLPTVSMTAPSNGATISGNAISLTANASDDVDVYGVQFKLDTNTNIGSEDTLSPYSVTWDSTEVSDGSHTLIAVARDTSNNYATSSAVTITVDNTAPTRSAGSPSGSQSAGTTQITLSLTTDENATCKYSTTTGTTYDSMTDTFSTTGSTSHSSTISGLSNDNSYNYYVRCTDGNNTNDDDYTISFSVASSVSPVSPASSVDEESGSPAIWALPTVPAGGFKVTANNGTSITSNRNVLLSFNAGKDVKKMAISMTGDFTDANQEDYIPTKQWDLCSKFGGAIKNSTCPDGTYTIYVKFYTAYGRSSDIATISSSIILNSSVINPPTDITKSTSTNQQSQNQKLFTKHLRYGMYDADIKRLQQFLNLDPDTRLDNKRVGSPGKETNFFGPKTWAAVKKFQEKYSKDVLSPWGLIRGTGYVGRTTLAKLNELISKIIGQ